MSWVLFSVSSYTFIVVFHVTSLWSKFKDISTDFKQSKASACAFILPLVHPITMIHKQHQQKQVNGNVIPTIQSLDSSMCPTRYTFHQFFFSLYINTLISHETFLRKHPLSNFCPQSNQHWTLCWEAWSCGSWYIYRVKVSHKMEGTSMLETCSVALCEKLLHMTVGASMNFNSNIWDIEWCYYVNIWWTCDSLKCSSFYVLFGLQLLQLVHWNMERRK